MPRGRHRAPALLNGAKPGTIFALAAAVALLAMPVAQPVEGRWPVVDVPGFVAGRAYDPAVFVDERTSVGVLRQPTGRQADLVVMYAGTVLRTLQSGTGQFTGVTVAGDRIAWLAQLSTDDGPSIWAGDWRTGAVARLTTDVGDFVFFNSEDDLRIDGSSVLWIAGAPGDAVRSELRSASLTGGAVGKRVIDGAWQLVGPTRLASAMTGDTTGAAVLNWRTGALTKVRTQPTELMACGEKWCRAVILGGDGEAARIDVLYADGSHRRTAITSATAPLVDIALLGRWEAYAKKGSGSTEQLYLYDLDRERLTAVTADAGQIGGRQGFVWWSTGTGASLMWHALDLGRL